MRSLSPGFDHATEKATFSPYWSVNLAIPLYCLCIYGILNFRKNTIFNRLSAIAVVTNVVLFGVLIYKAVKWSKLETVDFSNELSMHYVPQFRFEGTIILSGVLQGSFYVNSHIITIVSKIEDPRTIKRDVSLGFLLTALSYVFVGVIFYLIYPGWKLCISDVFINVRRFLLYYLSLKYFYFYFFLIFRPLKLKMIFLSMKTLKRSRSYNY